MKGKLIALEGTDGSGKSTQFDLLCKALDERGIAYKRLRFPRYAEESSCMIRMYLNGQFGSKPEDVGAYTASTFYAIDRYASFQTDWKEFYENGGLILTDRYTTSNAIHQAAKLSAEEQQKFLDWLFDFEYRIMGIPAPDDVFFVDMPTKYAMQLLDIRAGEKKDIHEQDFEFLYNSYQTADMLTKQLGWHRICCVREGQIRSIQDIHQEFLDRFLTICF